MRIDHALSSARPHRRSVGWAGALVAAAVGAALLAGPDSSTSGAASSVEAREASIAIPAATTPKSSVATAKSSDDTVAVPDVTPIKIRSDLDDLAVRPDGTIVVATESNSRYTRKPRKPAASAVRLGPLAQLPSLRLVTKADKPYTTQATVTQTGAAVAWTTDGKASPVLVRETADDGTSTAQQQLSAPGRSAWPVDAASGGGAVSILYTERAPAAKKSDALRLAYRAPGATSFSSVDVPIGRILKDFWQAQLVVGPSGDGAIAIWSHDRDAASLWRIGRDGTVGPELAVPIRTQGWIDGKVAVAEDGTIAAAFGTSDAGNSDQVVIAQVPAGSNRLAPVYRLEASEGSSLATQGLGLAVSPNGRLLVSLEDTGGSQVIVEGSGTSLKKTYLPYTSGPSTATAWMPDGSAVVVFEAYDSVEERSQLVSIRHEPGAEFGEPTPIGQALTPRSQSSKVPDASSAPSSASVRLLALVPAADRQAVLTWQVASDHGGHPRLFVARVKP
ncbi:MAG: hypothetical protein Q7T55_02535 [Solirubrobacteraceae bacterium]|nr:hypothetical protein [Solirubrobacteraceae bacterium]